MPNGNSVYFGAVPVEDDTLSFEVRVLSVADDFTTTLAVFTNYIELSCTMEISAPGFGSITVDRRDPGLRYTLPDGRKPSDLVIDPNLWQVWYKGIHIFSFIADRYEDSFSDDGLGIATISGPGEAGVLNWAVVLPPGFPTPTAYFWAFQGSTVMHYWRTLLAASQARGAIPYVTTTFTNSKDSAGNDWADTPTAPADPEAAADFTPKLGTGLLDLLADVTGTDATSQAKLACEWVMRPGFQLEMLPTVGTDRSRSVRFYPGNSLQEWTRRYDRSQVANYCVARDSYGRLALSTSASSKRVNGHREMFSQEAAILPGTLRAIASNMLRASRVGSTAYTAKSLADSQGRRVFIDFTLGDWVSLVGLTGGTGDAVYTRNRVVGITFRDTPDGVDLELSLEYARTSVVRRINRELGRLRRLAIKSMSDIPDVDLTTPATDGQVLRWDPVKGTWKPGRAAEGSQVFVRDTEPEVETAEGDLWVQVVGD